MHSAPGSVELLHARIEDVRLESKLCLHDQVGYNPHPDAFVLYFRNYVVSFTRLYTHGTGSTHH